MLSALAATCAGPARPGSDLPPKLVLLVQEDDHAFYYLNETKHRVGFSHELIERMQRQLSVPVEVRSFADEDSMYRAFAGGEGHIMCPAVALERTAPLSTVLAEIGNEPYPTLRFKVSDDEDFVWVLNRDLHGAGARLHAWLRTTQSRLFVANLYEKYFAHLGLFNKFDLMMLKVRYRRDLPRFWHLFEEAGRRHRIDPVFLAAMSYQESHWNPEAESHTGVRGLMMLTREAAADVGVTDPLDPQQSVFGGARYLMQLRSQIHAEVSRPDNDYYALAAYNVGLGHVEDAQVLLRRAGEDHTLWSNLRDALPLLAKPAYYTTLKYGRARGNEPVRYVDSIRNYYVLLSQLQQPARRIAGGD